MSDSYDPMDYSLLGSSAHGILQARILEWVAIPYSGGIFLTQVLNPGLLHHKQILYQLSYEGSPTYMNIYIYIYAHIYEK